MIYSVLFVGNMLHYLGQELHKNGYGMLICDSCNNEEMEKENLQFLLSRKVDGISRVCSKSDRGIPRTCEEGRGAGSPS